MRQNASQRILETLATKGPLTAKEIARFAFIAASTLSGGGYIKRLKAAGQIHICGWRKASNGFNTPIYKAGTGIDLPKPKFRNLDRDSIGMAKIVAALRLKGSMTYRELALATGLSANTIKNARYMDILLEQRRVHIAAWQRNTRGPMTAVYAAGRGTSAQRPPALSNAEKLQRHRAKQRKQRLPGLLDQLRAA